MKTQQLYHIILLIGITFCSSESFAQPNYHKAIKQLETIKESICNTSNNKRTSNFKFESLLNKVNLIDTIQHTNTNGEIVTISFTYDNDLNMLDQLTAHRSTNDTVIKTVNYNSNNDVIEVWEYLRDQYGYYSTNLNVENYDYDYDNRLVWEYIEPWENGEPIFTKINTYSYEQSSIIIEKNFFELDVLDLYETHSLTLDSLGNIVSGNIEREDYKNDYTIQYTQEFQLDLITSIGYKINNGNWEKSDSTSAIYEYDSSGNLISREKESFSLSENIWESSLIESEKYLYNQENLILKELFNKIIDPNSFFSLQEYFRTYSYTYDSSGYLISKVDSFYSGNYNYGTDDPPVRTSYNYDSKNRLEEISIEQYFNDEWIPLDDVLELLNPYVYNDTLSLFGQHFRISYDEVTSVEVENENLPNNFALHQNYPNPFNPTTTIEYSISSNVIANGVKQSTEVTSGNNFPRNDNMNVSLKIYDILGKEVATLVNQKQKPGNYKVDFFAASLPSGVYFYKLISGNFSETKKLVLMK